MHIRAVAAAALLLVPVIAAAAVPRAPAVPAAVGGDAPYRLVLSRDAPTSPPGGAVTVTLTVTRPPTDGTAPSQVDPEAPITIADEAIGVALTSSGGATIAFETLIGCPEVFGQVCRLHGEVGVTSTVTFSVDVPADATDAAVQATITEYKPPDAPDFGTALDPAPSESAELSVGPGFPVTYSPEVVRPGEVVRVVVRGLPTDGDWRLSWSQGVAPVGPFRSVGGVIDASFPVLQFDPLGPRTLLVSNDAAAAPLPTTSRVPLLVVPGAALGGG
ncbi:MAG: hypothetical protein QOE37_719 [Microbacteriaceae bacterium]|nr:hypothetical protein [Microbacteriaceae bacterium]